MVEKQYQFSNLVHVVFERPLKGVELNVDKYRAKFISTHLQTNTIQISEISCFVFI